MQMGRHKFLVVCLILSASFSTTSADEPVTRIKVTIHRGTDLGQSFGSLFEATSKDGSFVVGAGFPNLYNTRYRADRHAVQFFIRPTNGERTFTTRKLPRPNKLCGTYLFGRDNIIYSTYGESRFWNPKKEQWQQTADIGGTKETMRLGNGVLEFGLSTVRYNGKQILSPPEKGNYQLFFYANGNLCFYHVNRGNGGYRPYKNDKDGFSKLISCPWSPDQDKVDLSKAKVYTLPVVGETTFAWGQLGKQIVTGSNIGGFYVFENGTWRMILEPQINVSYQLYSTLSFHDRLLMGQYPTGRLFEYDGKTIKERTGWPPKLAKVSGNAREAQTTVIYGGEVFVGVWPWGELWRYNPDVKRWKFVQRMFEHPDLSDKITHPYDVESKGSAIGNLWGQRVTSLVPNGTDLFVSTSAKFPCRWDAAKYPFLAPNKWQSYGSVYRMTTPGHLSVATKWTNGPTRLEFILQETKITITQDGKQLATSELTGRLAKRVSVFSGLKTVRWGDGIYGRFSGKELKGIICTK